MRFRFGYEGKRGGTGVCVRCEEAGTRPSARVGLAMSVFTHGVTTKGKPSTVNRNKVFPVESGIIELRVERTVGSLRIAEFNPHDRGTPRNEALCSIRKLAQAGFGKMLPRNRDNRV